MAGNDPTKGINPYQTDGMRRDRIMQMLGLTVGLALAAPVAPVSADSRRPAVIEIEIDLRGDAPVIAVSQGDDAAGFASAESPFSEIMVSERGLEPPRP